MSKLTEDQATNILEELFSDDGFNLKIESSNPFFITFSIERDRYILSLDTVSVRSALPESREVCVMSKLLEVLFRKAFTNLRAEKSKSINADTTNFVWDNIILPLRAGLNINKTGTESQLINNLQVSLTCTFQDIYTDQVDHIIYPNAKGFLETYFLKFIKNKS